MLFLLGLFCGVVFDNLVMFLRQELRTRRHVVHNFNYIIHWRWDAHPKGAFLGGRTKTTRSIEWIIVFRS